MTVKSPHLYETYYIFMMLSIAKLPRGPMTKAPSLRLVLTWGEALPVKLSKAWKEATTGCRKRFSGVVNRGEFYG